MAIRNCAFGVGACIILTMAAPRTYGEMVPPQIVQLTDQAGVICKTVVDYHYRSLTADPATVANWRQPNNSVAAFELSLENSSTGC
jgi:hypothetical protein